MIAPIIKIATYAHIHTMARISERMLLYKLAKTVPPNGTIVEIGCYGGGSTCLLGTAAQEKNAHVYSIDPFTSDIIRQMHEDDGSRYMNHIERKPTKNEVKEIIQAASLDAHITLIEGFSTEVAQEWTQPIDMLWIDGNHLQAYEDYEAWRKHLASNAIVAFHDAAYPKYGKPEVTDAVNTIIDEQKLPVIARVKSIVALNFPSKSCAYQHSSRHENHIL